jgi:hypothetical protein
MRRAFRFLLSLPEKSRRLLVLKTLFGLAFSSFHPHQPGTPGWEFSKSKSQRSRSRTVPLFGLFDLQLFDSFKEEQ